MGPRLKKCTNLREQKRGTTGGPQFTPSTRCGMCGRVNAYAIGCGVLATIEQWYPARKFNGTMVPHKRNSKVWPGLVTKEKTMKYPTSAMCTVYVYGYRVWGTCNNRTMVPHKEIQWNNGTPQGKFYSLATFGYKGEDNQVPHKCHV